MIPRSFLRATAATAVLLLASCTPDRNATGPDALARSRSNPGETPIPATVAAIRVNEVESNFGTPGDWVEFYNTAAAPVDVSGLMFRDNDDTRQYVIPAGTTIPANGFLVLDEAVFGFGLGGGDAARLFAADGTTLLDSYTWTAHAATTYARCPDGTGAFATSTVPTKGSANDCDVALKINEVESSGGVPGDWIEIFNPTAASVAVGGYVVRDNDNASNYVIPSGTTIAAGGFLVVEEAQMGFALGSADAARLFRPNGTTLVDSYEWTVDAATTYGRCPDGSGSFVVTASSTKGAPNACATVTTVVKVNEVESNGGTPGDWVEFFNTGNGPVDLSGYVFRDNVDGPGYTLPSGSVIAAGGFLVLDEAQFGFGLGASDAARLFGPGGVTLVDSYVWTAHAPITYGRCPDGTGAFQSTTTSTKGTANDCALAVRINEIESNLGTPGDWVELFNAGPTPADVSGWVFRDNVDGPGYTIPTGTVIPAAGYLVLEEAQFGFGLGSSDAARLFTPGGTTLADSYVWTAHATTTYGRCPNGSGPFVTTNAPTKGTLNSCPGDLVVLPWPGDAAVSNADAGGLFGGNMSGLWYQPATGPSPSILWAVRNGPGTAFRLDQYLGLWTPLASRSTQNGLALRYADGTGDVDAEGVTVFGNALYVAAERNNSNNGVSRNSILRYDVAFIGSATLIPTHEWNITADLPVVGANLGLEGITRITDSFLTARGFFDESKGRAYQPSDYPGNGGGLYFVGVEANGMIYAYALDHTNGSFTRVASFTSGWPSIMELTFDGELGQFWAICDNTCNGRSSVLAIDTQVGSATRGRFVVAQRFERPTGMANLNNEGFAIAPLSECVGGRRPVFWSDDSETGGVALRRGTVTCTPF